VKPEIDNPQLERLYYSENGLNRLVEILQVGRVYKGLVKDLPGSERMILEAQGILSVFITPIFQDGKWWGFIGYDECNYEREWNDNEIQLLNTVADIFTAALERESMEQKISAVNQNFKSLFHQSPDGIFVYNHDGYVLDVNQTACELNGISRDEIIGLHVTDLVPDELKASVGEDFSFWRTGKLHIIESYSKKINGQKIPVEIRGTPISFFEKPAILLLVRDISQRKKSEALLKKRIEFIQFISQISSEFIKIELNEIEIAINNALRFVGEFTASERGYVFQINNTETQLVLTNEYCKIGYKPHKGILDNFLVSDFQDFIDTLKRGEHIISHFDEIPNTPENENMRRVLEMLEIKSFINIPLIVGGHFLGIIGFDATSKKTKWSKETINAFMLAGQIIANTIIRKKTGDEMIEARRKAEQSDRLKTAFLGQMSHEMRTPLNSIIGFAEMLERDLENDELREMAHYIIQGGNRLLNTFNLVIDLSEIEANVMQAKTEEFELNGFIKQMLPLFSQRADEKNLNLDFTCFDQEIFIYADEALFEKVVHNLVDNALKYTRQGEIKLVTAIEENDDEQMAVLKVIDTGIGIEEDKIKDVFSKFRQASEGYNREFEGSGLWLSVTQGMIELMDGEITVKSTPGKGYEFTIKMPLVAGGTKNHLAAGADSFVEQKQLPKILIVEDEIVHQKFIKYILKDDYELFFTENGDDGLEMAKSRQFDLIIMDINLGKNKNGMETMLEIRQMENYKNISAIAATANVMKGHKELFLSKGFTHYLAKPYRSHELKDIVDEILMNKATSTDK
jgi:PAS domain S-box-containing protein